MDTIISGESAVYFQHQASEALKRVLDEGQYSQYFILTDENTSANCLPIFLKEFPEAASWQELVMHAGEEHKNLETCSKIWDALSQANADRKTLLINLGGGVVTDLGGFVACTYKRGIDFINIPTSLLAMVDASVGGKTGIDFKGLKNQIGIIRQPKQVLIHPQYLNTLPMEEIRSGFAEMLKHGLIADRQYWEILSELGPVAGDLIPHIHYSVALKNKVVLQDPLEGGLRKILNFGHTLGHAIETYFLEHPKKQRLLHGEAIAMGMIMEAHLSCEKNGLPEKDRDTIKEKLHRIYPKVALEPGDINPILSLLKQDKKNTFGRINFSLLQQLGECVYDQQIEPEKLAAAIQYYLQ